MDDETTINRYLYVTTRTLHKYTAKGWRLDETSITVSRTPEQLSTHANYVRDEYQHVYKAGVAEAKRRNSMEDE